MMGSGLLYNTLSPSTTGPSVAPRDSDAESGTPGRRARADRKVGLLRSEHSDSTDLAFMALECGAQEPHRLKHFRQFPVHRRMELRELARHAAFLDGTTPLNVTLFLSERIESDLEKHRPRKTKS